MHRVVLDKSGFRFRDTVNKQNYQKCGGIVPEKKSNHVAKIKQTAFYHFEKQNWSEFAKCCLELIELEPQNHEHCLNLSRCFGNQNEIEKQVATLTIGEQKYPANRHTFATHKIALLASAKSLSELENYIVSLAQNETPGLQELIVTIPSVVPNDFIIEHLVPALIEIESSDAQEGLARLLSIRSSSRSVTS